MTPGKLFSLFCFYDNSLVLSSLPTGLTIGFCMLLATNYVKWIVLPTGQVFFNFNGVGSYFYRKSYKQTVKTLNDVALYHI